MSPEQLLDILEVVTAVDLGDYDLFQARKRIIAAIQMDEATIVAKVRCLNVTRLAFNGRFFDLEIQGVEPVPAVVIFALDGYEQALDLVAWPVDDPARLATLCGSAAMLGAHHLEAWVPYAPPVPVYRTAIAWMKAGCAGVVPVEPRRAARAFINFDGELVAETDSHGRELAAARAELVDRAPPILVAEPRRRAA